MFKSGIEKLRKDHDKLVDKVNQLRAKISELEAKAQALKEENQKLESQIGETFAKSNLGELDHETAQKEAEALYQKIESNRFEIMGCNAAIEKLKKQLKEVLEGIREKRLALYLETRDKVLDQVEKAIKDFNKHALELLNLRSQIITYLNWLSQMKAGMSQMGYKVDRKVEETLGDPGMLRMQLGFIPEIFVKTHDGYKLQKPDSWDMKLPESWEFIQNLPDTIRTENDLCKALGVRTLEEK